MVLSKKELDKICIYCNELHDKEPLDGDEIEQIDEALKEFNGDNGEVSE